MTAPDTETTADEKLSDRDGVSVDEQNGLLIAELSGSRNLSVADIHVEGYEKDGGAFVDMKIDTAGLSLETTLDPDVAERLIHALRDELITAKEAQLEWETEVYPDDE